MAMTETRSRVDAPAPARSTAYNALVGLATLGVLLQGLWAGLFVHEGKDYQDSWVQVHALDGEITFVLALIATIVAVVRLRHTRADLVVGTAVLTVLLVIEAFLGSLIGNHPGVTAIHFPLAMAIMGLAVWLPVRAAMGPRR